MKITKKQLRRIIKEYGYGNDYVVHPTEYVEGAMKLLTPEEFNAIGIEKMTREAEVAAGELRNNWPADEGFGSSDRTYELQGFLEMLGFKTGFPNGTLEVIRESKMKITKNQLRRIIKEEKARLSEQPIGPEQGRQMQLDQEFRSAESAILKILQSMDPVNRNANIYSLIDELEDLASRG